MTGTVTAAVLPLSDVSRADIARVGGKGANLGELLHAGLLVPAGFVGFDSDRLVVAAELQARRSPFAAVRHDSGDLERLDVDGRLGVQTRGEIDALANLP